MLADFPLHRFEEFGKLSDAERQSLGALAEPPRAYRRGTTIRPEGEPTTCFYLLVAGWVLASQTVPDGGRQITKVHLPGDALGTPSMCLSHSAEALTAMTNAVVSRVSLVRFGAVLAAYPRFGTRFLLSVQYERVALTDRLASIGRTAADARVAAVLLDMMERLEPLHLVTDGSYLLPLTQEQLGDLVGLTSVHTNRMLRDIEDRGLIARSGQLLTITDRPALERLAARPQRRRLLSSDWLPPS